MCMGTCLEMCIEMCCGSTAIKGSPATAKAAMHVYTHIYTHVDTHVHAHACTHVCTQADGKKGSSATAKAVMHIQHSTPRSRVVYPPKNTTLPPPGPPGRMRALQARTHIADTHIFHCKNEIENFMHVSALCLSPRP